MRKVIAAMNMTLDGFCDHTAMTADDELHQHYNDLLSNADILVYGRVTYQLMESYWPGLVQRPSGNNSTDEFAVLIDNLTKVVFSHTLQKLSWRNSVLAKRSVKEEILELKHQPGKDILVGSPSMIDAALDLNLVDEFQICVQPIIIGKGLTLLKNIHERIDLKLLKTKIFAAGAIVLYYAPER